MLLSPYQKLVLLKLLGKKSFILVIVKMGFFSLSRCFFGCLSRAAWSSLLHPFFILPELGTNWPLRTMKGRVWDSDVMFHFQYLRHVQATANWTIWLQETSGERQQMSMKSTFMAVASALEALSADWLSNAQPDLMGAYLRLFFWKCDTRAETSLLINQWHQDPTLR